MNEPQDRRIGMLCWAGLAIFTLYLLVVNRSYYFADTQVPTYDEAWYLETSLNLYHRLTSAGLGEFLTAYAHAFGTKAPLIAVLPIPFYLLYGTSLPSAMLVNSLFLVMANVFLFLLVRRLFSPSVGLAAVVFYQTMPLAYGLSRNFMTEYGLAALVIVWMYFLAASDRLTRLPACFAMGVTLGFGLLMKVLFPAFIAGPLLWALASRKPGRSLGKALAAIAIPAAAIAATWYTFHLPALLEFAWHSAYGGIAGEYSAGGFVPWILLIVNQGVSAYYALAIAALGGIALAVRGPGVLRDSRALLLLSWFLPPFLATAAGRNQLIRFVLPLLPVFAIVLALAVFHLGRRWMPQAALAVLLAVFPQRLYAALSYPPHAASHAATWGPLVFFAHDLGWVRPPVAEDPWEHRRLLEAIRHLGPDTGRPYYAMLAVDHVYLNANLMNYVSATVNSPVRFTSLGYGESSAENAIDRIYRFDSQFVIVAEGFRQLPEFLNRLNHDIAGRIERGELPFRRRAEVPLAHDMRAILYERDAPWQRFAAEAAPRPSHATEIDFPNGLRLAGYDWTRRAGHLWELTLYWTVRQRVAGDALIEVAVPGAPTQDFFLTGGRHPLPEWVPGEWVRESRFLYLQGEAPAGIEATLSLIPWGVGPSTHTVRLRLVE